MTKQDFLEYCLDTYGTAADYPFDEDFETTVFKSATFKIVHLFRCLEEYIR